ncbi:thiol reductant ABC exporter subunit CydC [Motilimonas cestriensis]|uniref:Thiol reductant ABC exporter subunit CydC n=1 Tax=Motilimonas cestriensis TaxID=2742685 RepID=A0ABS8W5M6_9GAMM|nr:thiol reductant ABC exporter subunit CydC [Motilimonas cestriensis]MCE2593382.1 thiol reductant ABC exporter subunit CydC [Motilimonas cestriensis]
MRNFFRLLELMRPQLGFMLLGALLSLLALLANISLLAVSGWFLTIMAMAGLTGASINYFTPGAVVRFLAIVRTVGRYAERVITHEATFRILAQLRYYFYQKLEPLLPYYQVQFQSADLLTRMQQDIDNLDNFYLRILLPAVVALVSVPLVCAAVAYFSVSLALVLALVLIILGLGLPYVSYLWARSQQQEKLNLNNQMQLGLVDGIFALRELVMYQVAERYQVSMLQLSSRFLQLELALQQKNSVSNLVNFLLVNALVLCSFIILVPLAAAGKLAPEYIASLSLLMLVSIETVMALPLACQLLPQTLASAQRLFDIVDMPVPHFNQGPDGLNNTVAIQAGAIAFNHLSFSYPGQQTYSLTDIHVTIQPGQKVAIIGPSGAGKSTLVNLLMGFWPTAAGQVTIAEQDINGFSKASLRQHIALMSQTGHIFNATIADNLRLANPDATTADMVQVCQQVGLGDFIASLEFGIDTWLGETGAGLSGGQKQRLQLAQVLLRDSRVLVLDEPSKGLDGLTEQKMMDEIFSHVNAKQQTLMMITHKPIMLQQMDLILVMAQGQIIAQGDHTSLMRTNEYYRDLLDYF